jgi:hypothetical protein
MKSIVFNQKQITFVLIAAMAMSTSGVLAYDIRMKNITGYEVEVTGACQNEDIIIPNGQERTLYTGVEGACCADPIVARGTEEPILGKEAISNTIVCTDYYCTIKKTADNRLVIEQGNLMNNKKEANNKKSINN